MDKMIFNNIPFDLDVDALKESLKLRRNKLISLLDTLAIKSKDIAKPKGIYIPVSIDDRGDDFIVVNGTTFHSKVLKTNTEKINNIFLYVITCGTEIEELSESVDNIMEKFILDGIMAMILQEGTDYVAKHIKDTYNIEQLSYTIPGLLDDWPMEEQKLLFPLMGDVTELIGVRLTDSSLMRPAKSVSGIYFPVV